MLKTDICHDEYHKLDAASSGTLRYFLRPPQPGKTPAHWRYEQAYPSEPTPAMWEGQHIHCRILEPDVWESTVVAMPKVDRRTKAGKEEYAAALARLPESGVLMVQEDIDRYDAIRDAVLAHPFAGPLIESGQSEVSVLWEEYWIQCKARFDSLTDDRRVILDLKTTTFAHPDIVSRHSYKLGYHHQAAWYLRGARAAGLDIERFVFVFVEKTSPHMVCCYELDSDALDIGDAEMDDALRHYVECRTTGLYPGYGFDVQKLSLPAWAAQSPVFTLDGEEVSL